MQSRRWVPVSIESVVIIEVSLETNNLNLSD